MPVKVKDIVTVTLEASYLKGKQGEVVEIIYDGDGDGPVGVRFPWNYPTCREEDIVRFQPNELRVDPDWGIEAKARRIYGHNMFHSLFELNFPFSTQNTCMHEGCEEPVAARIMVNIWGSVIERDVCQNHSDKWNGKCADSFPDKPNWKPAALVTVTA